VRVQTRNQPEGMFSFKYPALLFISALLWAEPSAMATPRAAAAAHPNILILTIDDLRPELGCYGAVHMQTPAIDALAAESMRFDHAYIQQAVCLPSRISLFTGMRPNSTGVHDLKTDFRKTIPDALTMTQFFGQNGYTTIGIGKVYHDEKWGEWDEWIDTYNMSGINGYQAPETQAQIEAASREARAKGLKGKAFRQYTKGPAYESADAPDSAYHDGAMTDLAIAKLKELSDSPFYMVVGYKKPHLPFVAPKKYWDLYPVETVALPENYYLPEGSPKIAHMTWGELRAYSGIPEAGDVDTATAIDLIRGYYASISFVDAQVGRLMHALEEEGLVDNTIVVLWGDHGWKLGEHRMWCKHTNYEIDTRVPFLIKAPGAAFKVGTTDALVELLDLFPTLSELAGLPVPEQCEGTSLVPLLEDPEAEWHELAYSQFPRWGGVMGYSVKSHEGRYTEWLDEKSGEIKAREYYDHRIDPDENLNRVDLPEYAETIAALSAAMRKERGG
jgi:iduronate 2-sulfatase